MVQLKRKTDKSAPATQDIFVQEGNKLVHTLEGKKVVFALVGGLLIAGIGGTLAYSEWQKSVDRNASTAYFKLSKNSENDTKKEEDLLVALQTFTKNYPGSALNAWASLQSALLVKEKEPEKAQELLVQAEKKLAKNNPLTLLVALKKSELFMNKKEWDKALASLESFYAQSSYKPEILLWQLSQISALANDTSKATKYGKELLSTFPTSQYAADVEAIVEKKS